MINLIKARTPILAIILSLLAVGYTFAANRVVVVPMAADEAQWALVHSDGAIITGSSGVSSIKNSTGGYFIKFGKDVTGHAVVATPKSINRHITTRICGGPHAGAPGEAVGCSSPYSNPKYVLAYTFLYDGSQIDTSFYIAVLP